MGVIRGLCSQSTDWPCKARIQGSRRAIHGLPESVLCTQHIHGKLQCRLNRGPLQEGELVLDSPKRAFLPVAGKTPTTPLHAGSGPGNCSRWGQWGRNVQQFARPGAIHVSSINVGSNFLGGGRPPSKIPEGAMAPLAPPLPTPLSSDAMLAL